MATALLAGTLWLAMGTSDPALEEKLASVEKEPRGIASAGSRGTELVAEAIALSNEILERKGTLAVPADLRLSRAAPEEVPPPEERRPPGIASFTGALEESHVVLRWEASGGEASGWRVERLEEDRAVLLENCRAEAREFRDGPVDTVTGTRRYRLKALAIDGSVASLREREVPFRVKLEMEFVGLAPDGRARFRVGWPRDGGTLVEEFRTPPGETIGEVVPSRDERPELDWRTDHRFVEVRFSREQEERTMRVPRFGADGRLERDPESGEVIQEERSVTVFSLSEGAVVNVPGPEGRQVLLQKAKD
ncbi:MAG: hypothetical protein ACYS99_22690 [Planctomycetota bacterium]